MQRFIVSLAASACLVALLGVAAPAYAAFATFASGNGSDAFDCLTPATACREIFGATAALSKTDEGGIIHVLPGEYIAFTVDKSLDIVADAGQASIYTTTSGDAGIFVNVTGDKVVRIRGFNISAAHGIKIEGAGMVHIEDCTLTGAETKQGIVYTPTGVSELYVSDTTVSRPSVSPATHGGGIQISPTGSGSAKVVLDSVNIEDNKIGILVNGGGSTGAINVSIRDSVISGSTAQGLSVFEAPTGGSSAVVLERTTISSNGTQGIFVSRALASVRVRQSVITGNGVGVASANGGQIISHGDNVLAGNTTNGAFTSTVAPQ